jgi:hypothetical protein
MNKTARCSKLMALAFITTLSLGNYAGAESVASGQVASGFIPDYSLLQPVKSPEGTKISRYQNPDVNEESYTAIIIEPIFINQAHVDEKLTPEIVEQTRQTLNQAIRDHIGKTRFNIASEPGPGVARVAIAISGAELDNEGLKPRNLMPISAAIKAVSFLAGKNSKIPVLLIESKITDSQSDALLRAGMITINGETFRNESDTTAAFQRLAQQAVTAAVSAATK